MASRSALAYAAAADHPTSGPAHQQRRQFQQRRRLGQGRLWAYDSSVEAFPESDRLGADTLSQAHS